MEQSIDWNPEDHLVYVVMTKAFVDCGMIPNAREMAKKILQVNPNFRVDDYSPKNVTDPDKIEHSRNLLRIAGLK